MLYDKMVQETQERIGGVNAEAERNLRDIKAQIQLVNEENSQREAEMMTRMQNDATELQSRLSDIDKQVKNFVNQLQAYKTADQLKEELDTSLDHLKKNLTKVDLYQNVVDSLNRNFESIEKINDDVESKLAKFSAEQNQINMMNQKFDRLINLSGTMDQKINELQTTSDDLQALQLSVRGFQESLGEISGRYDRLEKKQSVIDKVNDDVDKAFEELKKMEQKVHEITDEAEALPDRLFGIKKQVEFLTDNAEKITSAVDTVTSLQNIVEEAEKRVDQVQKSREGIARSETRLERLSKDVDEKIQLLARMTQNDMNGRYVQNSEPLSSSQMVTPVQGHLTPQDKETVLNLKRQGWTNSEIARSLKISESEVEVILEMGM